GPERRLRVLPGRGPGGGVTAVPDGHVALEGLQDLLVENLTDEPEGREHDALRPVTYRDARCLLAAVLQGVEPVVGHLRNVFTGSPDAEDATLLTGFLFGLGMVGDHRIGSLNGGAVCNPSVSGAGGNPPPSHPR